MVGLHASLEIVERRHPASLELVDPAIGDLVNRDWIEIVELLASSPCGDDEIGFLEQCQVLADGLARHVESLAQVAQRLAVGGEEPIEQLAAARIGECFEDGFLRQVLTYTTQSFPSPSPFY